MCCRTFYKNVRPPNVWLKWRHWWWQHYKHCLSTAVYY